MLNDRNPIFYDNSGRRWLKIWRALLVFFIMLVGAATWMLPAVSAPVMITGFEQYSASAADNKTPPPSPEEIVASFENWKQIPILGRGPLLRVIRLGHRLSGVVAEDPFTNQTYDRLTPEELEQIGSHLYAIERYGETNGKRIALTFDDGPDPRFSPILLDILGKESAPSTFFVMGGNVVRYPELARRMIAEGHILGNHSFTHADLDLVGSRRAFDEINTTARVIREATGHYTFYFRPPYIGHDDRSTRGNLLGILRAQKLGYVIAGYTIDTQDWQFPLGIEPMLPPLSGRDEVVLLHDSGGDRTQTVGYVERFIAYAKSQGYTFVTLNDLYPTDPPLSGLAPAFLTDQVALWMAKIFIIAPQIIMAYLLSVLTPVVVATSLVFVVLAVLHTSKAKRKRNLPFHPFVSVLVPAYNEEKVIGKTIQSLLASTYPDFEIIIIDDGSTDRTREVAITYVPTGRVRVITKENGGKASALNAGHAASLGDILVTLDADTLFTPKTIANLVRHFVNPTIGAVAGVVKVGNRNNLLTNWQALEYIYGITIHRQAQSLMGAIAIVPGACSAWLKSAVEKVGGLSGETMAEDCDLNLSIQKAGYRVVQDMEAIAYTEAPENMSSLLKQRFRWTFGSMQALWKHRDMIARRKYGLLGTVVLPFFVFTIMIPLLFTPLIYLQLILSIWRGDWAMALMYAGIFVSIQLTVSFIALRLAREHLSLLILVPFSRFIYDPIHIYILYTSFIAALKGQKRGWGKIQRKGTVATHRESPISWQSPRVDNARINV